MPAGRPTVWNEKTEERLFYALELGLSRRKACDYAGIGWQTFHDRRNADPDFSDQVKAHEAEGIVYHADRLRNPEDKIGSAQVAAAKFYLSTHDRQAFVERKQVEHSGALTIEQLLRTAEAETPPGLFDEGDEDEGGS